MDEKRLERLAHEIHRRISDKCQRLGLEKPNYVNVKNLLRHFIKLNPDADVEDIDWVETWDASLSYEELIEAFERSYPSYRWREEEYPQERYEDELVSYVLTQVEELSERSLRRLVEELRSRLGVQEIEEREKKTAEAIAPPFQKAKPRFVIDLVMLAKYPWLPEAREFARVFSIEDAKAAYDRATERLQEALKLGDRGISVKLEDPLVELLSFPVAKAVVAYLGDSWFKRRWCLAESVRCEKLLHVEDEDALLEVIKQSPLMIKKDGDYMVRWIDYLKSAKELLSEPTWSLADQTIEGGYIHLSKARAIRLLRQAIYNRFLESLDELRPREVKLPEQLLGIAQELKQRLTDRKARITIAPTASQKWPPCMKAIAARLTDATHMESFSLAAYLLRKGYDVNDILEIFKARADFNERIARYQVEHIAGLKGSGTKYLPPSCEKMRTLGLCVQNGALCPKIRNPVEYYQQVGESNE